MIRHSIIFFYVLCSTLLYLGIPHVSIGQEIAETSSALPSRSIAIIEDSKSAYADPFTKLFAEQIKELSVGSYELALRKPRAINWDLEKARTTLRDLLQDEKIDLIFTSGVVGTRAALELSEAELTKPIMAGATEYAPGSLFPISQGGTSRREKLSFISSPRRVERDIELLKKLSHEKKIFVLLDKKILETRGESVQRNTAAFERELGVNLEFITFASTAQQTLNRIPKKARAIYFTLPLRMKLKEQKAIYDGLIERKIVHVAMHGQDAVVEGALAGLAQPDLTPSAKRAALNAHQMLQGIPATELPVYLPTDDQLCINAQSAEKMDFFPDYDTALEATFIDKRDPFVGEKLSLEEAMKHAAKNNAARNTAKQQVLVTKADEHIARSRLFPQLNSFGSYDRSEFRGEDTVEFGGQTIVLNQEDNRARAFGVSLSQILYNDELISSYRASRRSTKSAKLDERAAILDAMEDAGIAYLDLLLARVSYKVEKENLQLTRNNLELARIRNSIGVTDVQEVYRWEANLAEQKADVIQSEADIQSSFVRLNRVLGEPRGKQWEAKEIDLKDDEFYFLDRDLKKRIAGFRKIRRFGQYFAQAAKKNSPELASFDALLEAQGIISRQRKRRLYVPELSLDTELNRFYRDGDLSGGDQQNEWFLGLRATFPLYEGGGRFAEIRREQSELMRINNLRLDALQFIEQQTLVSFNGYWSQHPNIRLSRIARNKALKNYSSVRQKYTQGDADILDLLDAQEILLNQQLRAESAVYEYLKEIIRLQRALSWFEFEKTQEEREEFVKVGLEFVNQPMNGEQQQ